MVKNVNAFGVEIDDNVDLAVAPATANTLLDNGADITAEMENGETPLYVAAENGHNNIIHELMIEGSNLYQNIYPGKKMYKNTILMAAIIGKNYKISSVYYSNKQGEIEKCSLNKLNLDPCKHISGLDKTVRRY
jgi:ankyrin repeat protein